MTKIVGIINVTPDSFSDGGAYFDADFALQAITKFIEEGADVIDIGAESTRPGATLITQAEEWQRLEPVLKLLSQFKDSGILFSVDTRHAETARRALALGIHWINDVTGFSDLPMIAAVKSSDCKLVVMHSLGVPADKKVIMGEADVVPALLQWGNARVDALVASGINKARIIFDPGIGFGKSSVQSLAILRDISQFKALDVPILIGHSRKSFLTEMGIQKMEERDDATLAVSQYLAQHKVDYLRVHTVARHTQMLSIAKELHG
jgi:dihydropteroate synthase